MLKKRLVDAMDTVTKISKRVKPLIEQGCHPQRVYAEVLNCIAETPTVDAVVLPCKMGDMVYVITYCRCGNPECYDKQHCHKKETARTPKVLASKMVQQMGRKYNWKNFDERNWEWKPCGTICYRVYQKPFELKMLVEIGKTVFLSLEEAKQALSNCGTKMDGGNEDG